MIDQYHLEGVIRPLRSSPQPQSILRYTSKNKTELQQLFEEAHAK